MKHLIMNSGRRFQFDSPDPAMVRAADVAHHLSMLCRFAGACRSFYSVAQHSVLMAQRFENRLLAAEALLHDAPEAYYGDITTGLKQYLDCRDKLAAIDAAVREGLGLGPEVPPEVEHADRQMLMWEADQMVVGGSAGMNLPVPWVQSWPTSTYIVPWSPERSRDEFLTCFRALATAAKWHAYRQAHLDPWGDWR